MLRSQSSPLPRLPSIPNLSGHRDSNRHSGSVFVSFERLLDLHMKERHPNLCVLPASADAEWQPGTAARNLSAFCP